MQVFLVILLWIFMFTVIFSTNLSTSVHGYLLGDVAINCGCLGNSTALDGRRWVGETPLLRPKGNSRSSTSVHKVLVSADPTPYLTARISFSHFSYCFHVNPGHKFIRFHFYPEIYQGFEYSRDFFTVEANSFTLLQSFSASLAADAMGVKYVVKEYCLNVNETGILQITFFALQRSRKRNNFYAFVNGIEIISMPTGLYYTPDDNLGPRIVGQRNGFHYIDISTALELVQRLNAGGDAISPVEDKGMFRMWKEDVDYRQEVVFKQIYYLVPAVEYAVSPPRLYQTSRKLRKNMQLEDHFIWRIPVDIGFSYLLRLHFCSFGIEFLEGGIEEFEIVIQNHVAESQINVIQMDGGKGTPGYKDYLINLKGGKDGYKLDLVLSLQPFDEIILGLLKGIEIFKLSNSHNSLASPNPSGPKQTYSFWTLKISSNLVAFGSSHVIMAALTILLALVSCGVYRLKRIYCCQEKNMDLAPDEPSCHRFSLTEISLATQDFNEALVIGKGGFGKVYKGFIHGRPEILAIKRLNPDSKQGAREFWCEIEMLSKLRHAHLVSLLGYCMEKGEMILVYEYMPRGTIADNLYKSDRDGKERIPLTWEQRLRICIGAARGLEYLHTGIQYGIIHRDVKDTNILLDENLVAKISDFGLSKLGNIGELQGEDSTQVKGTIGFLDPNYITTHKPSIKSDVYAFGIVLLVVLSGKPAVKRRIFEVRKSLLDWYHECVKKGEMNEIIDPCCRGEIMSESFTRFMEAVGNCLHRRPNKRPTMAQLVVLLENALEKQIVAMPSTLGDASVLGQSSPARSKRSWELYEFQFEPKREDSITSPLSDVNKTVKEIHKEAVLQTNVEVLRSKGNNRRTPKPLFWLFIKNILMPRKKMDLPSPIAPVLGEWNHPVRDWKHPFRIYSLKDIKLATENFSAKFLILRGGYSTFYKGFFNDGTGIVAIKRFMAYTTEYFRAEVELLSTIRYVHLVPSVGLCNESNELIIVYEYMSHGSLKDHLYGDYSGKYNQIYLTWERRLKICIGAARGLNHLHEAGFIHTDLRVEHIMFNDVNFVAKISNFGQSKRLSLIRESETRVSTSVMGTSGQLDTSYNGRLTKASDVYSFGIILLVVLSGTQAREKEWCVKDWYETCSQKGNFNQLIDPKFTQRIPSASLGKFVNLIGNCLHEIPTHRPVMAQVVVDLQESLALAQMVPIFNQESNLLNMIEGQTEGQVKI